MVTWVTRVREVTISYWRYRWLRVVMGGHGWLWVVTGGYKWLRVVTGSHEWLRGLQGITGIMGGGRAVASRSFDLLNSMIH